MTTTTKPKYIIGSVSSGTMRERHLIPAFLGALRDLGATKTAEAIEAEPNREQQLEELFDALDELAPPYFYFGSHPGDGADYGFWLSEGAFDDFDGLKVADLIEVPADYLGEVLYVNDHGNMTLYSAEEGGKLTEIWAIV